MTAYRERRLSGGTVNRGTTWRFPKKHKPMQITIAVIVAAACWMPFRGLWWLAVSDAAAMWLAVPSSIAVAVAFYFWYGYMQDSMQD